MKANPNQVHLWIVGGGIAGMAAAFFAIRDGRVPGNQVHILEMLDVEGGSLDGAPVPQRGLDTAMTAHRPHGWFTRGARMFQEDMYRCTWDLMSTIPSLEDPAVTAREEFLAFNKEWPINAKARLIDGKHKIVDATKFGFDTESRIDMMRLLSSSEVALGAKRIDDIFEPSFFESNFWQMWRTTFAFQKWHSAAELKRYFYRLVQEFSRINTLAGTRHTKYNQYDSLVVPLQRWLLEKGVDVRYRSRVIDADFENARGQNAGERRVTRLHVQTPSGVKIIDLGEHDHAIMTLGSITADTTVGDDNTAPELIRDRRDGSWTFWENIARKADDFGNPIVFCGNVDEHKWESFTPTMHSNLLLRRISEFTGNDTGSGGLITFINSGWHMSIDIAHQPHFADIPEDTYTLWGYGFEIDHVGDYVKKKMSEATGREILTELVLQFGFDDILDEVLDSSETATVMMPYASALFATRTPGDRPKVVPDRAGNFAFVGQFVEMPEDVVFTVEYSVHAGMLAVYTLLGVDRQIPPIYHGMLDPKIGKSALQSMFR